MRVLHIGKYYPPVPGGMEYFLRDLLLALLRQGVKVSVLVHHDKSGVGSTAENIEGVSIIRTEILGHFSFSPVSIKFPKILSECIHHYKPDILHFHLPNASAFSALLLPSARKIPWIVHWHSDVIPSNFNKTLKMLYPFYSIPEKIFLQQADRIIATSPEYLFASSVLKKFVSKCTVIPLGIDANRVFIDRHENDLKNWAERMWGSASYRLLSVGRLTYYKGFDMLIKTIATLPDDIALHIVGSGNLELSLKKLVKNLRVNHRVYLHGYLPGRFLSALFRSSDCFIIASLERTEAFGLVLLEAMWHSKPIIASNIKGSGVRWVVNTANSGLLFEPGNINDCAKKILWMKNNPERALQYGKNGRIYLEKHFLIDHIAKKIVELYKSLK